MKRAIRRLVGSLTGPKKYLFFVVLILVCIVALCLGIYAQFFYKYSDTDVLMLGINIGSKKTAEEIDILKSNFNNLFTNTIIINSENVRTDKMEPSKELVYTGYNFADEDENYFTVNAQIPILNINHEKAKAINADIKSEFYDKANSVMRKKDGKTIYTVTYASFVNGNVLSIVVKSSLKEEGKAEKVTVKTYNYSIADNQMVTLSDLIREKETTTEAVQTTITNDVKKAYTNAKIIADRKSVV